MTSEAEIRLDPYDIEARRRRREHQVTFGDVLDLSRAPVEAPVASGVTASTGWCAPSP